MRRKVILGTVLFLIFAGAGAIAWTILGWPPPRLVLKYRIPPYCEPTGREMTVEGIEFVEIGPGCFRMGSEYLADGGDTLGKFCTVFGLPWGDHPKPSNEMPVHWVEFQAPFWIAKTEVTYGQFQLFDPSHERWLAGVAPNCAKSRVSWEEAKKYCGWLATKSGLQVRLPSEAEWECACRAGSRGLFSYGDEPDLLSKFATFADDTVSRGQRLAVADVGVRSPNMWGLFDMHGNVWEWCEDVYHASYDGAPADGSAWTRKNVGDRNAGHGVVRGGGYLDPMDSLRSARREACDRISKSPLNGFRHGLGFRIAFTLPAME